MVVSSMLVVWSASRVGVHVEHACRPTSNSDHRFAKAFTHACALVLQGIILVSLFGMHGASAITLIATSVLLGVGTAYIWSRWRSIPHDVEMAYIMLTFGNVGMIAGWWADAGFQALQGSAHCNCATAIFSGVWKPWMWLGMFFVGNLGMIFFTHHSHSRAMYTGGNVGMGLGMLGGGWLASQWTTTTLSTAGWLSLVGMTVGMMAGMWVGTTVAHIFHRRANRVTPSLLLENVPTR
jgi:Cu+-exporting ATPase